MPTKLTLSLSSCRMRLDTALAGINTTARHVATGQQAADDAVVIAALQAITQSVFDTIKTTRSFTLPIPAEPEEPQSARTPKVDTTKLLTEITDKIEADRAAEQSTIDDIARINHPEAQSP